jgi:hypothetical protein
VHRAQQSGSAQPKDPPAPMVPKALSEPNSKPGYGLQ